MNKIKNWLISKIDKKIRELESEIRSHKDSQDRAKNLYEKKKMEGNWYFMVVMDRSISIDKCQMKIYKLDKIKNLFKERNDR